VPPAWKVLVYATVVLVLFAVPAALWGGNVSDPALLVTLAVMFVTVAVGYRIGYSMLTVDEDDE